MNKFGKITLIFSATILATTMIMTTPTVSHAAKRKQPSVGLKLVDAIFVRPASLVMALAGSGIYVGTTPLTVPTGMATPTAKYLFRAPWKYTYGRPLGSW